MKGGRCEACNGDGIIKIEMLFLPDVYVPCDVCHGKRYNRETLEVKYKGKSIFDVLDMNVTEALEFFRNHRHFTPASDHGGCGTDISLGQPSSAFRRGGTANQAGDGGEKHRKHSIYSDEPTTGRILRMLKSFCRCWISLWKRNTVVVIEHNMDVIKRADHIIDLKIRRRLPRRGDYGGEGTPEEVARIKESYTGQFLAKLL